MKLEFKEVGNEYNIKSDNNLKIRPYLKIEEINDIVNQCLATENQVERELIKVCKTIEYCTNIDLGEGDIQGEDVYNSIVEYGYLYTIKLNVGNYDVIDECIRNSESIFVVSKMFIDNINEKLKDFDINKIQDGFGDLKEVIGNGKIS